MFYVKFILNFVERCNYFSGIKENFGENVHRTWILQRDPQNSPKVTIFVILFFSTFFWNIKIWNILNPPVRCSCQDIWILKQTLKMPQSFSKEFE